MYICPGESHGDFTPPHHLLHDRNVHNDEIAGQITHPVDIDPDDDPDIRCQHYTSGTSGDADADSAAADTGIPPQHIKHDDRILHNDEITGPPLDDGREQKVIDRDIPLSEGVATGGGAVDIIDANLSDVQDDPDAPKHPLPNEGM
jgi:hypothetical protein